MKDLLSRDNRTFALRSVIAIVIIVWAVWVSIHIALPQKPADRFARVQLQSLVEEYVMKQARSGKPEQQITSETQAFMSALDQAVRKQATGGRVLFVNEAIVGSTDIPDISRQVRAEVYRHVPEPMVAATPASVPGEMNQFFQGLGK